MKMWPRVFADVFFGFGILLTVVNGDVLISKSPPKKTSANQGDNVKFVCRVDVPTPLSEEHLQIKWKHGGSYLHIHNRSEKYYTKDKGQALTIKNVNTSDAGVYTCIVSIGEDRDIASGRLIVKVPPSAPKNVSIVSCTGNSAEISWIPDRRNSGDDIPSYLIQFNTSDSPTNWNYYYDGIPGELHTTHINLSPYGTYNFRMLAKNSVGYSKPSKPTKDRCTTPPDRPDGNPQNVRTLTYKKGKLIVTWTPMPRLLHNGPSFKYVLSWRPKGSTYWHSEVIDNTDVTTCCMWEVPVNDVYSLYEIMVKSQNSVGDSRQPAFRIYGYTGESEPSVEPNDFRLDPTQPIKPHRAHFIWEAVDTAKDKINGDFKGYKLRYWKSSEGRYKWKEVDIIMTQQEHDRVDVRAAIDNLPADTALRAQVAVRNTHYSGPPSQIIDFITPEGVPEPVRNLHVDAHGTTYALLKWLPPEEPNGHLLGYDIAYQSINQQEKGPIIGLQPLDNPDTLGAKITGLLSNHKYRFYVWAKTMLGRGAAVHMDVTTEDGKPPDTPRPKFTSLDQTSVNITWAPYMLLDVSYELEYRPTGHAHWKRAKAEGGRSWMVINNLLAATEYEVRVTAKNRYGDLASSTLYRVQTSPRRGHDAHLYQPDQSWPTGGTTSLHEPIHFSLFCSRSRTLLLQTLVSILTVCVVFH